MKKRILSILFVQCLALGLFILGIKVGGFSLKESFGILFIAWAYKLSITKG
ncbi:MAG: hypothetical protein AABY22_10790 [Nanoarchaeota archaeon]